MIPDFKTQFEKAAEDLLSELCKSVKEGKMKLSYAEKDHLEGKPPHFTFYLK